MLLLWTWTLSLDSWWPATGTRINPFTQWHSDLQCGHCWLQCPRAGRLAPSHRTWVTQGHRGLPVRRHSASPLPLHTQLQPFPQEPPAPLLPGQVLASCFTQAPGHASPQQASRYVGISLLFRKLLPAGKYVYLALHPQCLEQCLTILNIYFNDLKIYICRMNSRQFLTHTLRNMYFH